MLDATFDLFAPVRIPRRHQLRRTKGWRKTEGAISVVRGTPYGNPFYRAEEDTRGWMTDTRGYACAAPTYWTLPDLIQVHRDWVQGHPIRWPHGFAIRPTAGATMPVPPTRQQIAALRGHDLCCWCGPGALCHADTLIEIANGPLVCDGVDG